MQDYWQFIPQDPGIEDFVFWRFDDSIQKLVIRDYYRDLLCMSCRRIDQRQALQRPILSGIHIRKKAELRATYDHCYVIGPRLRQILQPQIERCVIRCHSFPDHTSHAVIEPVHMLEIDPTSTAFRPFRFCEACHRYREVVWGPGYPKMPVNIDMFAFRLENRLGDMPAWFVNDEIALAIRNAMPIISDVLLTSTGGATETAWYCNGSKWKSRTVTRSS